MAQAMADAVPLQQEDLDEECIHLMPREWCGVCKNGLTSKKTYDTTSEVRVLVEGNYIPHCDPWMWSPVNSKEPINKIPINCKFVHISGCFSSCHIQQLVDYLENLVAIEVTPSVAHVIESNIKWYKLLGIRIIVRCRYRQS